LKSDADSAGARSSDNHKASRAACLPSRIQHRPANTLINMSWFSSISPVPCSNRPLVPRRAPFDRPLTSPSICSSSTSSKNPYLGWWHQLGAASRQPYCHSNACHAIQTWRLLTPSLLTPPLLFVKSPTAGWPRHRGLWAVKHRVVPLSNIFPRPQGTVNDIENGKWEIVGWFITSFLLPLPLYCLGSPPGTVRTIRGSL